MGNKNSSNKHHKTTKTNGATNTDSCQNEASAYISINVMYELPGGTTEMSNLDVASTMSVEDFVNDLSIKFKIDPENILIFRHNGKTPLPSKNNLKHYGIKDGDILRVKQAKITK